MDRQKATYRAGMAGWQGRKMAGRPEAVDWLHCGKVATYRLDKQIPGSGHTVLSCVVCQAQIFVPIRK